MGPGSNNCHLCEQGTIEREGEEDEEGRGGERRREKKEVQIQLRSGVILDPNPRVVQMSRLPNLQEGYHGIITNCSTMKSNVNGRIEISHDGSIWN